MSLTKVSYSMINGAPFNVLDYGADPTGTTDSATAIQTAITAASVAVAGSIGATVYFPTGTYKISVKITIPNRVSLVGNGDYAGVTIKPLSGFTADYMFHSSNGTTSMFGSYIKNMYIDARGFNMIAPMYSQAWQETCGLVNVLIQFDGTTPYGFLYSNGYGGAAYLRLQEVQIFSDSTASTAAGILVTQISSVGGFVLDFQNGTIAGSATHLLPSGIRLENDTLRVNTYHAEYVTNMVTMSGVGSISADTLTGSSATVVNMVSAASTFTGAASLRNMIPNGATGNIFNDGATGRSVPVSVGMLASFDYQPSAFSYALTADVNNVTGNGTQYIILFNSKVYDYLNEYSLATGRFTPLKTGKYVLDCCVKLNVPINSTTAVIRIATTSRTYEIYRGSFANQRDGSGYITINGSVIVDMTLGDYAYVQIVVSGIGADTVGLLATDGSIFSGHWFSR